MVNTRYPALTIKELVRRHRAIKFRGWRRWSQDAQILIEIGIRQTSPVLYTGVGHEIGFLHHISELNSQTYPFLNVYAKARLRKALGAFQQRLKKAAYRPNYLLPLEYTKGFSNNQFECSCLLGKCERRNEHCISNPEVARRIAWTPKS